MKRFLIYSFVCALSVGAVAAIAADEATPVSSDPEIIAVHDMVKEMIAAQSAHLTRGYSDSLKQDGSIQVEKFNNYFAVTTPNISVHMPGQESLHLGRFALNLSPSDHASRWNMTMALPSPMRLKQGEEITGEYNFGLQRFTGLWDKDAQFIRDYKAQYNDVTFNYFRSGLELRIDEIKTTQEMEDTGTAPHKNIWFNPLTSTATIKNLSYNVPISATTNGTGKLDNAAIHVDIQKTDSDKKDIHFQFSGDGADLGPLPASSALLFPQKWRSDWSFKNVPLEQLHMMLGTMLPDAEQSPATFPVMSMAIMTQLPVMLSSSGTEIHVHQQRFENKHFALDISGRAIANVNALHGATAYFDLNIYNFDGIIKATRDAAKTAKGEEKKKLDRSLVTLQILKANAKIEAGENEGELHHTYNFVLDEAGKIQMNGADISPLVSILSGAAAAASVLE